MFRPMCRAARRRRWWILGTAGLLVIGRGARRAVRSHAVLPARTGVGPARRDPCLGQGRQVVTPTRARCCSRRCTSTRQRVAGLIRGAIDDAIDVESKEDVYGTQSPKENKAVNQVRMDLSKLVAAKVALNYVGHEAEFTGKGARVLEVARQGPVDRRVRARRRDHEGQRHSRRAARATSAPRWPERQPARPSR